MPGGPLTASLRHLTMSSITIFLKDLFLTPHLAPIPSPRNAEPGPGVQISVDTANKFSIAGGALVCAGGKAVPTWGDPALYYRTDAGAGLGRSSIPYFDLQFKWTAVGNYYMIGWTKSTVLSLANLKHALFLPNGIGAANLRTQGDTLPQLDVFYHHGGLTYGFRIIALPNGGALWLIEGGQFGTNWQTLGYTRSGIETPIWPCVLNYDMSFQVMAVNGLMPATPNIALAYFNGRNNQLSVSPHYQIGMGVSLDGRTIGRWQGNPVLSYSGAGWDSAHVHAPWVLRDGATYKMWFDAVGVNYQIGYATSADGVTWAKSGSNPVLAQGGAGDPDQNGCYFPVVYKDNSAPAARRWKMLYGGISATNHYSICYAWSADGITWTKDAARNPIITVGAGGAWDDTHVLPTCLAKIGSTYWLLYSGWSSVGTGFPQIGLVSWTDWDNGPYTKSANNPILAYRTGITNITANVLVGATSVTVANSALFVVGEAIALVNATLMEQARVAALPDGTHITLEVPTINAYTANLAQVQTQYRALVGRTCVNEGGLWRMWTAPFEAAYPGGPGMEACAYCESATLDAVWALDHSRPQPCLLAMSGSRENDTTPWDSDSAENVMFVLDADSWQRVWIVA